MPAAPIKTLISFVLLIPDANLAPDHQEHKMEDIDLHSLDHPAAEIIQASHAADIQVKCQLTGYGQEQADLLRCPQQVSLSVL